MDRYLFPNESPKGCVLHQPALLEDKTHCNVPDGHVVKLRDGLHSHPMLISDYKKGIMKLLNGKSLGYFQSVITICRKPLPLLVKPGSLTELSLYLCWPKSNTTHATIKILHAEEPKLPNFYNASSLRLSSLIIYRKVNLLFDQPKL